MNFERILVLLNVIHASIGVNGAEVIRAAAEEELRQHNSGFTDIPAFEAPVVAEPEPEPEPVAEPEPELPLEPTSGRRV